MGTPRPRAMPSSVSSPGDMRSSRALKTRLTVLCGMRARRASSACDMPCACNNAFRFISSVSRRDLATRVSLNVHANRRARALARAELGVLLERMRFVRDGLLVALCALATSKTTR